MGFTRIVPWFLLAALVVPARAGGLAFPGRAFAFSPNLRWRITCASDAAEVHSLRIGPAGGRVEQPLFETGRWCEVLWPQDGDFIAITDWVGSNVSEIYIVNVREPEAKRTLGETVPDLSKDLKREECEGHIYWEALAWESPSSLLIRVFGHTDEAQGHEFLYRFRVDLRGQKAVLLSKETSGKEGIEDRIWASKSPLDPGPASASLPRRSLP